MVDKRADAPEAEGPVAAAKKRTESQKTAFEAEQMARKERFERESAAAVNTAERAQAAAEEKAAADEELRVAQEANDELALAHGYLTDADFAQRREVLLQNTPTCLLPHQVLAEDAARGLPTDTVKMAFPTHAILVDPPRRVLFLKGINDVPLSLSDHQHLANIGAHRVGDDGKPEPAEAREKRVAEARAKREAASDKGKGA
jgi:hypothetical protein